MRRHHVILKSVTTYRTTVSSQDDQVMAMGNMYREFHEIWMCVF